MRGSPPYTRTKKTSTGTNNDGDLRGDEVIPCWFGPIRLLHRDFIAGSESPCGSCPVHCVQHVHPYMAYRPIQISLVEVKLKGEPLSDALSARTVEPVALLQ